MNTSQRQPYKSTPDLLTSVGNKASLSVAAIASVRNWLAGQLVAQEFAKLGQGGHTESQIPLRSVFVDLPVACEQRYGSDHFRQQLLSRLMGGKLLEFSKTLEKANKEAVEGLQDEARDGFCAVLLIGGPGQGKSTIGQLASQQYRALLLESSKELLSSRESELVKSFTPQTTARSVKELAFPRRALFPLTLELPKVAAWLGAIDTGNRASDIPLLIQYLAELPSAKEVKLNAVDLWQYVKRIPVFVVLDGFDEVGATTERESVVVAARQLFEALAANDNSGQVLATTRPQGYADEFSAMGVQLTKWTLLPLDKDEALNYAKKLVEAKVDGVDLQQQTLRRLREASEEPATQRLLKTPLQVTILTALVQQLGGVPRERWNLFYRYFSYTYDREIERKSYASSILLSHRNHIERIHARIALLLQVEAESVGGAEARMSRQRLEEVIVSVLKEDEVAEETQDRLVKEISKAAEQRLVFLVEPEPGRFGFEIRSLQEFMAAWALTDGRDDDVVQRLSQVARASMFRNVVVFVASRLYSNSSPLRENIGQVCDELNSVSFDELCAASKAGSVLAMDVIEEGAISSQPRQSRAIMERAVHLLDAPLAADHQRLASIVDKDNEVILIEAIRALLGKGDSSPAAIEACWNCLIAAESAGKPWAYQIIEESFDKFIETPSLLLGSSARSPELSTRVQMLIEANSNKINALDVVDFSFAPRDPGQPTTWLYSLSATLGRDATSRYRHLLVNYVGDRRTSKAPLPPSSAVPEGWEAVVACLHYEVSPSASSLAVALRQLSQVQDKGVWAKLSWRASWPLAACINSSDAASDLIEWARKVETGSLGNTNDWIHAEKHWSTPASLDEIFDISDQDLPWSLEKINRAPPLMALPSWVWKYERARGEIKLSTLRGADELIRVSRNTKLREQVAAICIHLLPDVNVRTFAKHIDIRDWLRASPSSAVYLAAKPKSLTEQVWFEAIQSVPPASIRLWGTALIPVLESFAIALWHPFAVEVIATSLGLYTKSARRRVERDPRQLRVLLEAWRRNPPENIFSTPELAIVGYLAGVIDPAQDLEAVHCISTGNNTKVDLWSSLVGALHFADMDALRTERILLEAVRLAPWSTYLAEALRERVQSRRSGLEYPGIWARLNLPFPRPNNVDVSSEQGYFGGATSPVHLKAVQLFDVGRVRHLVMRPNPSPSEGGQWVVILGENGAGKTTLLKSIALSLRNLQNPAIWPRGTFGSVWRRVLKGSSPASEGVIEVVLSDERVYRTSIRSDDAGIFSQTPPRSGVAPFPVFAYGCRRGSAMGGGAREVNLNSEDGPEIATLFDEDSYLVHAETWLVALEGDASKTSKSARVFGAVVEALRVLLGLEYIEVSDKKVWIKEIDGPRLHISSLSDGYLTTAGWFLDLVARWIEHPDRKNADLAANFLVDMTGLVLIDEIDLHLHPRWQVDVISRTRKVLPRMSFWVTTHNPLCLVGAKAEEIWVLSKNGDDANISSGKEAPLLLTGGQIYKKYFGISDIYPDELGRALQRYAFLFAFDDKSPEEQEEMERLSSVLKMNGVLPDWSASPQSVVGRDYND